MASIIPISGTRRGDFYRLGQRTNIIGRDEALPIHILDDCVSHKHMSISFDKRNWSYSAVDIDSKNGVAVNGVMNNGKIVLTDGDYITIGNTSLMFTLKDFFNRESAIAHMKRAREQKRPTKTQ